VTWTRIGDDWTDRPAVLGVSRSARLLLVELYVYANRHTTDGRVPEAALPRLTDADDWPALLVELVGAELVEQAPPDWLLDWSEQEEAHRVNSRKAYNAEKQKRYRDRKERHARGDHTACDPRFCERRATSNATSNEDGHVTGPVTASRPDPSRRDRGQGTEGGSARATPPRLRGAKCPHGVVNGISRGQCPDARCTDEFENLQACASGRCHSQHQLGDERCAPGACWLRDEWPAERDTPDGVAS
jgi:hypothetical protein